MSVQACLPNNCKNQHSIKSSAKSPSFLRHGTNTRQNTANRRSAVERLEESKANYVKSESVLDSKQEFKNSSHLHVSTGPQLDIKLKAPIKHSPDFTCISTNISIDLSLLGHKNNVQQRNSLPYKSPPVTRVRAKSHSESRDTSIRRNLSFASRGSHQRIGNLVDIESQLKRLISSGSKENILGAPENVFLNNTTQISDAQIVPHVYKTSEVPKVRRGYSDPTHKGGWSAMDNEQRKHCTAHKSLPDLSPPFSIPPVQAKSFHSDNSDDSIFQNCVPVVINRPAVQRLQPQIQSPVKQTETFQEPKRFSNGTGTLHLTPYCPQSNQYQRRPVIRSKSDVSHRYTKQNSEYYAKRNNHYTNAEIERFFDTMGLDTTVWHHITSPSSVSSPPCFFNSVSSIDSNDRSSTFSEESSAHVTPKEGLRNLDLKGHCPLETSIVEKNARVIKWLYNCRKAAKES